MNEIKAKTTGMQGTEREISEPGFPEIEYASEEDLLNQLKQIFEEEKEWKLQQLFLLFKVNNYLSPDFILDAIMARYEGENEEDEIDEHMKGSAKEASEWMTKMFLSWNGW